MIRAPKKYFLIIGFRKGGATILRADPTVGHAKIRESLISLYRILKGKRDK